MSITEASERVLKYAGMAHFSSTRIYNLIREVGAGRITADRALHQMVEDYKNLKDLGENLCNLAEDIKA